MTLTPSPGLNPDGAAPGSPSIVTVAAAAFGATISWWGYGLSIIGGAFGLFVALWREGAHPLWQGALASILVLTTPLAVVAMVLASPASFEAGRPPHRGVNGLIILPFAALLFSNLYHAQINPWQPAVPAVLAAVVVLPLAWNIRNAPGLASPLGMLTVITLCAGLYGYGAISVIDVQLDFSAGAVTPVSVLDKYETRGRRSHSYYLSLAAWGPRTGPNSIEVSAATYGALNIGDTACITQHPGALGLPWFTSGLCPAANPGA
jgi:hypothetical protein